MSIRFVAVNPDDLESSKNLHNAFALLQRKNVRPEWIFPENCMKITEGSADKEDCVFVCDPFEGPAFRHLTRIRCRVAGPSCVMFCIRRNQPLPGLLFPSLTATMKGILVTCTSLKRKLRREICEKVRLMGGDVSGNLTPSVTHVVASETGSKKCRVACKTSKPIMLPEWVFACWDAASRSEPLVHASDSEFRKYACPIFKGLRISVSQVDPAERRRIKRVIESNGGEYANELLDCTTHLVALQPTGRKYAFAERSNKVRCVTPAWVYESAQKGAREDEDVYNLTTRKIFARSDRPNAELSNFLASFTASRRRSTVFKNVVVCISRKLASRRQELHSLVARLGGKSKRVYDKQCTHFVHEGKPGDNRQTQLALDGGKLLVGPDWITESHAQGVRLNENSYPCTYYPLKAPLHITEVRMEPSGRKVRLQNAASRLPSPGASSKARQESKTLVEEPTCNGDVQREICGTVGQKMDMMLATRTTRSSCKRKSFDDGFSSSSKSEISPEREAALPRAAAEAVFQNGGKAG